MNLSRIDLNLLVYLDVLLREKNVTRAAEQLGITQPALSNGLRRLRDLFNDPLLVRTSEGMTPTERALELQPQVRNILSSVEQAVLPVSDFEVTESTRVFRVMASDYAESTLLTRLLFKLRDEAPNITLDILTPSDVTFQDLEQGKIDMAVNRFDRLPQSFHQATVWRDSFSCLMSSENKALENFDMGAFLAAPHIWVSKTGMGVGRGMSHRDSQRLGWVDEALAEVGHERQIRVFTRHYQVAALLARHPDLIATLPTQVAKLYAEDPRLAVRKPPFMIIPIELKLAWSPLLQHDPGHIWLRRRIVDMGQEMIEHGQRDLLIQPPACTAYTAVFICRASGVHQLSFGRVRPVGNIVELCIDEGRELTLQSLTEFRTWIGAHMPPRFAVLVTGSLDFSLGFEAQADLGNVAGLQAIAIVRQFPRSDLVFDVIRRLPRDHVLKLELFSSRDSACKWLREHLVVTH